MSGVLVCFGKRSKMEMEMKNNEGKPYGDEGASCGSDILGVR